MFDVGMGEEARKYDIFLQGNDGILERRGNMDMGYPGLHLFKSDMHIFHTHCLSNLIFHVELEEGVYGIRWFLGDAACSGGGGGGGGIQKIGELVENELPTIVNFTRKRNTAIRVRDGDRKCLESRDNHIFIKSDGLK